MIDYKVANRKTAEAEKEFIDNVTAGYRQAMDDIDHKIDSIYAKYSVDGKLNMETMSIMERNKVNRLKAQYIRIENDISNVTSKMPQRLTDTVVNVYKINYEDGVRMIRDDAGQSYSFDMLNREAVNRASLSDLGKLALESNEIAVKQNIKRSIVTSIVQGESIQNMKRRIQKDLETNANNAVRIARTETTRIMNQARSDLMDDAKDKGIELQKVWVSTGDERTRPSHNALSGQTVDADKKFSNGLMYPGDPSGPASEVINCRCSMYNEIVSIDGIPFEQIAGKEKKPAVAGATKTPKAKKGPVELPKPNADGIIIPENREQALKIFEDNNITITGINPIDDDIIKDYAVGMQRFQNEFPETKGFIKEVNGFSSKNSYARYGANTQEIGINKSGDFKGYETMQRLVDGDLKAGFHPAGATIESTFTHEQAHGLADFILKTDMGITDQQSLASNFRAFATAYTNGTVEKELIDKTLVKMGVDMTQANWRAKAFEITKEVGRYGATSQKELFAEAISDAVSNKVNALKFSKILMEFTKERLKLIK